MLVVIINVKSCVCYVLVEIYECRDVINSKYVYQDFILIMSEKVTIQ